MPRIGIDVGGVIMDRANDDTDTSFFSDNFLATTTTPGAIEAIAYLVSLFGTNNTFIVSKCGKAIQYKTLAWFEHHHFCARTGIVRDNMHFCRERREKAPIAHQLGLTHFIDDRLEVLSHLTTVPHRFLFQPGEKEMRSYEHFLPQVHVVHSWDELTQALHPTL